MESDEYAYVAIILMNSKLLSAFETYFYFCKNKCAKSLKHVRKCMHGVTILSRCQNLTFVICELQEKSQEGNSRVEVPHPITSTIRNACIICFRVNSPLSVADLNKKLSFSVL